MGRAGSATMRRKRAGRWDKGPWGADGGAEDPRGHLELVGGHNRDRGRKERVLFCDPVSPTICLGQGHMVVELLDTVNHCLLSENFFCLLDGAIAQTYFHRMQEFSNFLKLGLGVENFR